MKEFKFGKFEPCYFYELYSFKKTVYDFQRKNILSYDFVYILNTTLT